MEMQNLMESVSKKLNLYLRRKLGDSCKFKLNIHRQPSPFYCGNIEIVFPKFLFTTKDLDLTKEPYNVYIAIEETAPGSDRYRAVCYSFWDKKEPKTLKLSETLTDVLNLTPTRGARQFRKIVYFDKDTIHTLVSPILSCLIAMYVQTTIIKGFNLHKGDKKHE